ncbi:MAG: hypothetical protein FNNCIFGK_00605 [Bacteroidia bacterium]|nr:hypothetical protein [Bacteroidia bacterium]
MPDAQYAVSDAVTVPAARDAPVKISTLSFTAHPEFGPALLSIAVATYQVVAEGLTL